MEYIKTNKLRIKSSTDNTLLEPTEVRLGSAKKYRLMKGDDVVWDVLQTTFSASDFSIGANGGDVKSNSNVTSYGVNALGTEESLDWVCSPTTISANSSTSSKTHTITYTQNDTGDTTTAVCTQAAAVLNWTVSSYATTPTVPASGGTVSVTIHWDLYLNGTYYKSGTSSPSRVWLDGVYLGTSTVSVESAGTTLYENTHVVGYITNYEFYADGHFFDIYGQDAVYRAANTLGTKKYTYNVSLTKNEPNKSFTSSGGTTTITASSTRSWSATWSSGSPASGTENYSATISATNGSVSHTSISGSSKTVTLTVGKSGDTDVTITVTASAGGVSKSVSYSQKARAYKSTSYGTPTIGTISHNNIPASGGTSYMTIDWTQTKTITYDNDTTSSSTVNGKSTATILTGTIQQTGASLTSDGGVYKTSCGTEVTVLRTVYTVTSYKFTANDVERTVTGTLYNIGQAPNKLESTTWLSTYNISVSADSGNIPNIGGNKTIYITCTENGKETYTSTATKAVTRNVTATLTTTLGTLTGTSVSGSGSVTLTVGENFYGTQSVTVTATINSANKQSVLITQNAAVFELSTPSLAENIPYEGGTILFSITSKVNNHACPILLVTTDTSGITVSLPELIDSRGEYGFSITSSKNPTTSLRTIKVTVIQQYSNDSYVWTVTQLAQPVSTEGKVATIVTAQFSQSDFYEVDYSVYFDATNTNKYTGGTLKNVSVELNTMMNGSGTIISSTPLSSSLLVNAGTKSQTYSGTLYNSTQSSLVYFIVRYDTSVQFSSVIMRSPD